MINHLFLTIKFIITFFIFLLMIIFLLELLDDMIR